jgi:hypothetical protein
MMTAHMITSSARAISARAGALGAAIALLLALGGTALAGDCNADIADLTKKRQGVIDQLNQLAKGGKKQLDPIVSCPKLRALAAAERAFVAYLTKNKDWCAVPEEALQSLTASSTKTTQVATQACKVADQIRKAQQQQATGGAGQPPAQKLPSGPL